MDGQHHSAIKRVMDTGLPSSERQKRPCHGRVRVKFEKGEALLKEQNDQSFQNYAAYNSIDPFKPLTYISTPEVSVAGKQWRQTGQV